MKKILFVINNMKTGGIQKALINLLSEINEFYDINLIVFSHYGELLHMIPPNVNLVPENKYLSLLGADNIYAKEKGVIFYAFRIILVFLTKFFRAKFTRKIVINLTGHKFDCDVAISYMHNFGDKVLSSGCNEYVLIKTNSIMKLTFIHGDYSKIEANTVYNNKLYKKFDKIACVSDSCKEKFLISNPDLRPKTFTVRNCVNIDEILLLSNQDEIIYEHQYCNIITVARLSPEKGLIRCIEIIEALVKNDFKIRWYILGDGKSKELIMKMILQKHLTNTIHVLGNRDNPYKYMKNADFFFLPSYHEAAPLVFDECKTLGLPILTTNTCSAYELVEKDFYGWVCNNDVSSIYSKLESVIHNKMYENVFFNKKNDNLLAITQFKKFIGE